MNEYWFRPHRYGMGASPKTWEGWVVSLVYVVLVTLMANVWVRPGGAPDVFAAFVIVLTLLFVFLVWGKTEGGLRWRWGDRD